MPNIEQLSSRIEAVVQEHLVACQREAELALKRAFSRESRKPMRSGDRSVSTRAEGRSASELAVLGERLLKAVLAKPGETMRVIAVEAGLSARELQFPMRLLRQAKQVRSAGERNATRYYPMVVSKSV